MEPSLGCVIMGAGSSTRFGGKNKLLEPFADATVGEHVLNVLPFDIIDRSVLVTGSDIVALYSGKYNIQVLINSQPELGIGRTVKIGLAALGDSFDGYMFVVCDQPMLTQTSVTALINAWRDDPEFIFSLGIKGRVGNPFIFPASLFEELAALENHEFGRTVYQRHREMLKQVVVSDEYELMDIDTVEDLEKLRQQHKKRNPHR